MMRGPRAAALLIAAVAACTRDPADSGTPVALCNVDADGDGYGQTDTIEVASCDGAGVSNNHDDCDDADSTRHPGAAEVVADTVDQDCDGNDVCYVDYDRDTYGSASTGVALVCDDAFTDNHDDCDDRDATIHPTADEQTSDGVDQDCDGGDACYSDADGDGFGALPVIPSEDLDCADAGESSGLGDCLDSGSDAVDTWPGAAPKDSETACMTDADGDDFGADAPADGVTAGRDCDDQDAEIECASFTIGNADEFSSSNGISADILVGFPLELPYDMTVTHLALISKSSNNARMALYTELDGAPGTLVVATERGPTVTGAVEFPVKETAVAAGTYWILAIYENVGYVGEDTSSPPVAMKYIRISFEDELPKSYGRPTNASENAWNHYLIGY